MPIQTIPRVPSLLTGLAKSLRSASVCEYSRVFFGEEMPLWTMSLSGLSAIRSTLTLAFQAAANLTAARSVWSDMRILSVVRMTLRAVCSITQALTGMAALNVDFVRHQFHVITVNAWAKAAQVVRFKGFWNWATLYDPSSSRHSHRSLTNRETAIAVFKGPVPKPAAIFEHGNVTHEPFKVSVKGSCKLILAHCSIVANYCAIVQYREVLI